MTDEQQVTDAKRAKAAADLDAMPELSAVDILARPSTVWEWVAVPEWGGKVLVRSLSGTERDDFENSLVVRRGKTRDVSTANIRAKLCQRTIVDTRDAERMQPAFTLEQIGDLGKRNAAALARVYDVASRLSGLSEADVDELAGN